MASGNQHFTMARHAGGYSSDSSVLSHDQGHYVKRLERYRWWMGWSSLSRTSNENLESICHDCRGRKGSARKSIMLRRSDDGGRTSNMRQVTRQLWVTEVISGTGFYALSEQSKEKAAELKAILAAEMGDSPTAAERVVPRMVCAVKVDGNWERALVKCCCTNNSCMLRIDGDRQQNLQEKYWHVSLMEIGTVVCVPLSQLALVTREIASVSPKARLYFLRRVHLKDDENISAEAKVWLKTKIMSNQLLPAEVFYRPYGKGRTQAEIFVGNVNINDELVEAGYGEYNYKQDERDQLAETIACSSLQDLVSTSSRDSVLPRIPMRCLKTESTFSTLPELMELIDHLMKKRMENAYLTLSGSALNLAIKAQSKDLLRHHQGLCSDHGHAALNKQQILLRRLRDENPYIHEIRDLKDSLYEHLVEMFEKWKANYKTAQRKSDDAIEIIANIFLTFTNKNSGIVKCKHKCKKLETALSNEVLLQNEGQDLANMLVPAVATKLISCIDKLEAMGSCYKSTMERPQSLHHFITSTKYITPLTLETLAKDILKGLYHYHERGIAYKHLHPENILIVGGHAKLRAITEQRECKIGEDWPFEGVEVANEDLGKPGDVFNFGLLLLWMACKGADNYYGATMKFYCNVALIKMTMAEDPNQRPPVESMVCTNSPIFRPNSQWRPMPLKDYLREVFNDKCNEADDGTSELPSEMETAESTSESEGIIYHCTEDESGNDTTGNETTESEAPRSEPPNQEGATGDGRDTPAANTDTEQA